MRTIRLKLDSEHPQKNGVGIDQNTNRNPTAWQANGLTIELGAFHDGAPRDMTGFTAIELMIRPDQITNTNLTYMQVAAPSTALITANTWTAGTDDNASFVFTDQQMNIELAGAAEKKLWLVVTALDASGVSTVMGTAWFTLVESNSEAADPPPENPGAGITQDAADGRYVNKTAVPVLETGTARTLTAADAFTFIEFTNVAGCTVTVNEDVFLAGNEIYMKLIGSGNLDFDGTATAEIYEDYLPEAAGSMANIAIRFTDVSTYDLVGQLKLA